MVERLDRQPSLAGDLSDREIVITRDYDYPREMVFDAWTRPEAVDCWWGPDGFTTSTFEMAAQPGGVWRFTMHAPDGTDFPNRIVYEVVERPERLVYQHDDDGHGDHGFHVTVTFAEPAGRGTTRITMRSLFPTAEACEAVKAFGAPELGRQTLAHLDQYLASSDS